jgi:hypothetical protein
MGVRDILPSALQTAHCHRGLSAMQCWPGEDWLNVNSVYAGADAVEASLTQYGRRAPFFFIEGRYEQAPAGDRATLRRQAYGPLLSGGFGHVYGNEDVWHYDGPGVFRRTTDWRSALDSPGIRDMQRVWAFFSGLRWTLLEPDVDGRFLVDGRQQGEAMAATAVASDGSFAVIYAPTPRALAVNVARLAAPLARARWFDPTSGAGSPAAFARDGDRARFHVQPTNAGGDGDWVLLLET